VTALLAVLLYIFIGILTAILSVRYGKHQPLAHENDEAVAVALTALLWPVYVFVLLLMVCGGWLIGFGKLIRRVAK